MEGLITKHSEKEGTGVFATKDFPEGEILLTFHGSFKDWEDIEDGSFEDHHCLQIEKDKYMITKGPPGELDDFLNHSCSPNAGIRKEGENFILVTLKNLKEGDEVTYDYATWVEEDGWEMPCKCGAENCRKTIKSFSFLSEELQKKYRALDIIAPYL